MDLEIEVYKAADSQIFLTARGLAQGLIQFPDVNTLLAFIANCQDLLESFEGTVATRPKIPDDILRAFEDD